ncbi:GNAT family N-acetyltransferase [Ulvibacterium sp.]|uniref:GNAT family N-acetyltransferase n=1 Tax=Ulvibacterium sp. TaxID=2665914 RepID=UPI00262A96F7|nr:GNAT family N-acetyltransferase [Ulvibacterium sp.]
MYLSLLTPSDIDPKTENRIQILFKQLNAVRVPVSLNEILNPKNPVIIAYCTLENQIVGVAAMAEYSVISGRKGWIEDVVVDEVHRGKGIGRKLMEFLIKQGRQKGISEILLFTGYHRKPAHQLYQNLGFQKKESQIYTLQL